MSAISNTCIANFRGKLIGSMSTTKRFSYMGDSLEELMLIMNRSISLDFIWILNLATFAGTTMDPYSNMRHLLGILSNLVNVNSKSNYGITTIHVCVSIINVHSMLSGTRASVFFSVNVSLIEIHSFRAIFCGNVTILVNVNSKINYEIATIYVCVSIINVHPMLSDTRASAFFFC